MSNSNTPIYKVFVQLYAGIRHYSTISNHNGRDRLYINYYDKCRFKSKTVTVKLSTSGYEYDCD